MQRIYIFLAEVTTALSIFELTTAAKNEIFNLGIIILIRFIFHYSEKHYPSVKEKVKEKFTKTKSNDTN